MTFEVPEITKPCKNERFLRRVLTSSKGQFLTEETLVKHDIPCLSVNRYIDEMGSDRTTAVEEPNFKYCTHFRHCPACRV